MTGWRKKFAVIVLLLLPLQGLAATLSVFSCVSGDAHQTTTHTHGHDGGSPHEHDGETDQDHSGHITCHHFFSAMPAAMALTVPPELPAFESSISLFYTLFVPELPQRPPRA